MTGWTTPRIIGLLEDANPAQCEWIQASGAVQALVATGDDWVLQAVNGKLTLVRPDGVSQSVDFTKGKSRHRSNEVAAGAPHLKKSLGITAFKRRNDRFPVVVDATGGWGQDAWAIASLGCSVTVMEKHPAIVSKAFHR